MDKELYYAGTDRISAAGLGVNIASKPSMETVIRNLTGVLHNLSAEITGMSDRIHGAGPLAGISGAKEPATEAPAWADDLRQSASYACDRGETALRELVRIRETLGL